MPFNVWFPVFTLILGQALVIAAKWIETKWQREHQVKDRSNDFQRETLLALQDALMLSARLAAQLHDDREIGQPFDTELHESRRLASLEVSKHGSRALDERTRGLVIQFHQAVTRTEEARPGAEYESLRQGLTSSLEAVMEHTGELLRKL